MKMKKICLLFSMFTLLFSLTACSNGQGEVEFKYADLDVTLSSIVWANTFQNITDADRAFIANEGEELYKTGLSNFDAAEEECGEFKGFHLKDENGNVDTKNSIQVDLSALQAGTEESKEVINQISDIYTEITEEGENVIVILQADYEKRPVELRFVYEEDPSSAYKQNAAPYKLSEVVATPAYSLPEKMQKAGANTLMGMGTVFLVLIFISFIIAQFDKISKFAVKKEKKVEEIAPQAKASSVAENPMDDSQLVAVITAAITAANMENGSNDKLIVRSIKKAKR